MKVANSLTPGLPVSFFYVLSECRHFCKHIFLLNTQASNTIFIAFPPLPSETMHRGFTDNSHDPPQATHLSYMNPVHTLWTVLPSVPRTPKWSLLFIFPKQNYLRISHCFHRVPYAPHISSFLIILLQYMVKSTNYESLITNFLQPPFAFCLESKYSPHHSVLIPLHIK
jgi:hypothetical protein